MISCPNCGLENGDFDELCSGCGTPLGVSPQKNNRKAKRGDKAKTYSFDKKRLWRIAVATVAIAGVGIGGVLVAKGLSAESALKQATRKTAKLFAGSAANEDECVSGGRKIIALLDKGEYTVDMVCENYELTIDTDYNYSRKKRCMSGSAAIIIDGFDFSADYSIDDDLLLVSSPVAMENVYGVNLTDLEKSLQSSPLSTLLPDELLKLTNIDFFQKTDFSSLLRADGNKELKALVRSAKIKYLDRKNVAGVSDTIPCKIYQLTWDEEKAEEMISAMRKKGGGSNIAAFFANVLLKLDPDVRCYVGGDRELVGVDVVSAGVRYTFLLEGDKNPWDLFSLTVTTLSGAQEVFVGEISNSDAGTVCCLKNDQITYLTFTLTDTGDFALNTYGKGAVLYGNLALTDKGAGLDIVVDSAEFGPIHAAYKVSELKKEPKALTKHYIDILDMDFGDLQRFLFDLGVMAS